MVGEQQLDLDVCQSRLYARNGSLHQPQLHTKHMPSTFTVSMGITLLSVLFAKIPKSHCRHPKVIERESIITYLSLNYNFFL